MNQIAKDIYEATSYGDSAVVKRLLKSATFEDLIYKNPRDLHKTAVMVAAYHGHTQIVRAILSHTIASVYCQDEAGWTALMYAAYKGHTSTLNAILLHPEVDVNTQNNHGWTALMLAAAEGYPSCVRALLTRSEIDANLQNNQSGGTALLLACIAGHTEVVRDILSVKGVLVNLADKEGRLPLFAAKNDEITALINFYDPEKGLVYPVHDLPPPPAHHVEVTPMPPRPPQEEPSLALSVDFTQCEEEAKKVLAWAPHIPTRAAWHQHRYDLQKQMEAAVHIHHHKEAALIGRELLAFKATTASTAVLRALPEQEYVHLADRVGLLVDRLEALCKKLALVEDFDTMEKAAGLLEAVRKLQVQPIAPAKPAKPHTASYMQAHPPLPPPAAAPVPVPATATVAASATAATAMMDTSVAPPPPPPPTNTPTSPVNAAPTKLVGGDGVHTIHTALEALSVSEQMVSNLLRENESLRKVNRELSVQRVEEALTQSDGVTQDVHRVSEERALPPLPPTVPPTHDHLA